MQGLPKASATKVHVSLYKQDAVMYAVASTESQVWLKGAAAVEPGWPDRHSPYQAWLMDVITSPVGQVKDPPDAELLSVWM